MINKLIEKKAEEILTSMSISNSTQIDILNIATRLGVNVEAADLSSDISGLFVIKEEKPYIRYNGEESQERQRFTVAHELGHFILHKDAPLFVDKNEKVLYRNQDSSTGEILKEREANAFAAALLMPQSFVKEELSKMPSNVDTIEHLAKVFGVSTQAMSFRLSNLGYDFGLFF
jgi:Zn-dependent peptidase ImmA (M78 family)